MVKGVSDDSIGLKLSLLYDLLYDLFHQELKFALEDVLSQERVVEKPSIAFYFALVNTDSSGEYLDQVIMHLLFVFVDRLLPSHVS